MFSAPSCNMITTLDRDNNNVTKYALAESPAKKIYLHRGKEF